MKKLLSVALIVGLSACTAQKQSSKKPVKPFKSVEVVEGEFVFGGDKATVEEFLAEKQIASSIETLSDEDKLYRVKLNGKHNLATVIAEVNERVDFAEPNRIVQHAAAFRKAEWPTDKFFFKQWGLNNIGQAAPFGLPGVRNADMDVLKVWNNVTKGSSEIIVAVIDTGCDYTHPDLKDNMWVNEKESPAKGGVPGKDDDGNGYTDDVYGYDFVSQGRTDFKGVPGDEDPQDDSSGHGTHCAGSIGAKPNDGVGIAGVNWNVKIMCVRFIADQGGSMVDAYRAVRYARENGAHIMSNSWGGTGTESELFKAEMRKVQEKGILFVAAAGNNSTNNDIEPHYPSNLSNEEFKGKKYDNVLSVAASDNQDAPADFTNYGHETVDVFAPGVAIVSTYPQALTAAGRPPYATMSGTSMATPYVAGIAALMMAANPSLKNNAAEVIRIIKETADVKEPLIGKVASNGRINAYRAVTADVNGAKVPQVWQEKAESVNQRGFNTELVDVRHEIKVEGAKSIKVHFDFIQIEEPYDSIYLYDKDFRLISAVAKSMVSDFWSPAIPGDKVYVRFVNSFLQQITSNPFSAKTESGCLSRGATSVTKVGDAYNCNVDAEDNEAGGGSKKYTSFNSEGFSIDRVAFLTETATEPTEARKE